uniref:Histone H2A n=1 Tax=Globodera rostochiensis TaxID=31243 RepID=A0A914GW83_GLORO
MLICYCILNAPYWSAKLIANMIGYNNDKEEDKLRVVSSSSRNDTSGGVVSSSSSNDTSSSSGGDISSNSGNDTSSSGGVVSSNSGNDTSSSGGVVRSNSGNETSAGSERTAVMMSGGAKPQRSKRRRSRSSRAGLLFPVGRIHRFLRKDRRFARRVSECAPVYLAAVLQYLVAEVLELAGDAARNDESTRVNPRHVQRVVHNDKELNQLFSGVILAQGVVVSKNKQRKA